MSKKHNDNTLFPYRIEIDSAKLYGAVVRITMEIRTESTFVVRIKPTTSKAAEIVIEESELWFGILSGNFFQYDLDECGGTIGDKLVTASNIIKGIIQYGLCESALVSDDKTIESKCIIPIPQAPFEVTRSEVVLPWRKKKAEKREFKYLPYE